MASHIPANPAHAKFRTGARPTPLHKIVEAVYAGRLHSFTPVKAPPSQVIYPLPSKLSMWLNDVDGDCVTAEEAAAIAAYSMFRGVPEVFIPDASVLAFCNQFGVLNGADLLSVMQDMGSTGLLGADGQTWYKDGTPAIIDITDEQAVRGAIAQNGPLKIGIASSCLPAGAGSVMGWSAFGAASNQGEDHCVGVWHYGTAAVLCSTFGWDVPLGAPTGIVYTIYTWDTVGLVDWPWLQSALGEAYTRNPTSIAIGPTPPPPPPPPPLPGAKTMTLSGFGTADGTYPIGGSAIGTIPAGSSLALLAGGGATVTMPGKRKP